MLKQISAILDVGTEGAICAERRPGSQELEILAATGDYESLAERCAAQYLPGPARFGDECAGQSLQSFRASSGCALYRGPERARVRAQFPPTQPLDPLECDLLDVFCQRISAAYDNLYLYNQLLRAQEATVVALAALAEFRDSDTGDHVLRVQKLSDAIVAELQQAGPIPTS